MFCACWKDGTRWAFSGLWELLLLAGGVVLVARSSTTNRCGDALPCQSRAAFRPLNSCSLPIHQPLSLLLFSLLVQVFAQKRIHVKDIDLGVRNSSSHVSFVASCRLKTPTVLNFILLAPFVRSSAVLTWTVYQRQLIFDFRFFLLFLRNGLPVRIFVIAFVDALSSQQS